MSQATHRGPSERRCLSHAAGLLSDMPQPPGQSTFQLRIQLNGVYPAIWRRLLVPGSVRMAKLANMLIAGMGWTNSHLHGFRVGEIIYAMDFDGLPQGAIHEEEVTVLQALREEQHFNFDYDFGDSWEHEILIEDFRRSKVGLKFAVCLDGANACPPEDVGGTPGYAAFLQAISDPTHEERDDYLDWVGGSFDPTEFNLGEVNALLQKVR